MSSDRFGTSDECATHPMAVLVGPGGSVWSSAHAERVDAKARLSALARALESQVIPRLIGSHAKDARIEVHLDAALIDRFVDLLRTGDDADLWAAVEALRLRHLDVGAVFLELFAPAARRLGELWTADRCDFATVTICLGRLQRLMRELSPAFGREVEHPPNGRRILLAQHGQEQHSFGLSMVAEFFRRDGWEVLGGVGGAVADPSAQVAREWFDAIGFSIGSHARIDWLAERIKQARRASRNRGIVVLVGGPLAVVDAGLAERVGADGVGSEGGHAPELAERLLVQSLARC